MKNISFISDKYLCTGCGACNTGCPRNAINMADTAIGRKYACVDTGKCIECGLCLKVCPSYNNIAMRSRHKDPFVGEIKKTYCGHSTDNEIYRNAQSGGLCTTILKYLFTTGKIDAAVVVRMLAGAKSKGEAVIVTDPTQLYSTQKSCYTPVDILSVLKDCKDFKSIAIVGLPCHIKGSILLSELNNKYNNISWRIGLVCDRVLCSTITDVFQSYVSNLSKINWRHKYFILNGLKCNYRNAPVTLETEDGKVAKVLPNSYRFALKDTFTAPHCRLCYDKINTFADITLGDPWGMSNIDWKNGDSLVLVRTNKGVNLIKEMCDAGQLKLEERKDASEAISGQFVDERISQTPVYADVLDKMLGDDIVSNLFPTAEGQDIELVKFAENDFKDFFSLESKNKEEIIKHAKRILKRVDFRTSLLVRVYYKIKSKIK